jgi:Tol biopolymer transport system component
MISTARGESYSAAGTQSFSSAPAVPKPAQPGWRVWVLALSLALIAALAYLLSRPLPAPSVSGYVAVTHDGNPKFPVGTDGARLYFNEITSQGPAIAQVSTTGGDVAHVPVPAPTMVLFNVSPDGASLLVADEVGQTSFRGPVWSVPVLGGPLRKLGDITANYAAWSPDGKMMVYSDGSALFLAHSDGSESHKLASLPTTVFESAWSPDGTTIRFRVGGEFVPQGSLWEVSVDGKNLHPLLPGWHNPTSECCGKWTADGKYFVFESQGNIWVLAEKTNWFGNGLSQPVQLTSGPMTFSGPVPSKDGTKLFVVGALARGELTRYDVKSGAFVPFLSGISADSVSFSKDAQWVAYVTFPDGTLWKSKADGSQRMQLSYPPLTAVLPSWSPDGKQLVFYGFLPGKDAKMFTVSADGGTPRELIPEDSEKKYDADWSPDGTKIIFGNGPTNPTSSIRILDVKTQQLSTLPGSTGLYSPRWSPDGHYIAAMNFDSSSLMLFDFQTQKWDELAKISMGFPNWSRTGDYIYFLHEENAPSVMRVRLRDRKIERVADLKNFRQTGYYSVWLGMAPDDSPLLLRDTGTMEIYALDWQTR